MKRYRHAPNPAKVKAQIAAIEPPAPVPGWGRLDLRRRPMILLLCLLSAAMLLISFTPFDQWYLAYVALVPWALAVTLGDRRRWSMLAAYLAGMAFWGVGLYWLSWVTMVGFVAVTLLMAAYWLVAAALLRWALRRGLPAFIALPVIWVALEYARSWALSGFTWFYLAGSQYANLHLVQMADITGEFGLSFFVAMVNGAIVDVLLAALRRQEAAKPTWRQPVIAVVAVVLVGAGIWSYGAYRLGERTTHPGPRIGVVQQAFPINLEPSPDMSKKVFDAHLAATAELAGQHCNLVVWPESMLGYSNPDPQAWYELGDPDGPDKPPISEAGLAIIRDYRRVFAALGAVIDKVGCPLLGGGERYLDFPKGSEKANSAFLLDRDGQRPVRLVASYDKMHLVPFSEYVPFKEDWPWFHELLRKCVPAQMPQLVPGRQITRFAIQAGGRKFNFAVPICYEGTFGRVCRPMVYQDGKQVDLLVNISNDGWFVYDHGDRQHASSELEQHLAVYVFRAVENRVPIVRAVNTGISGYVDSFGRIVQTIDRSGRRKMVAGNMVVSTVVDDRVSVYSHIGDAFALAVTVVAASGIAWLWWTRRSRTIKRMGKNAS